MSVTTSEGGIRSAVRQGLFVWFALLGGIGAWTVHLMFLSSFVEYSCNAGGVVWPMHAVTAVTAAVTVGAMALSWRLVRLGQGEDESSDADSGRARFLGHLGLLLNGINLMLILVEGFYVFPLHRC